MLVIWILLILLVVCAACATIFVRRSRGWIDASLAMIVFASLWVVLSLATIRLFTAPQSVWNDARLAEVVATLKHYPLYLAPRDGPIRSYKYGPLGAAAYLPAGIFANTPTNQILLGSLLTAIYFFLPVIWVIRRAAPHAPPLMQIAAFACFAAMVHNSYTLAVPSFWIHTDAPALGLAACSIALALYPRDKKYVTLNRIGSALCAVLAFWTKQTVAPILLVLPLWSLLTNGRRQALRDALYLLILFAIVSIICVNSFDAHAMEYYMYSEPSHHLWETADNKAKVAFVAWLIVRHTWLTLSLLIAVLLLRVPQKIRPMSSWLNQNRWMLPVMFAIVLAPSALFGWVKPGGASNNAALITYFLLIAAVSALADFEFPRFIAHWPEAKVIGQAMVVLVVAEIATRAFFGDFSLGSQFVQAMHPNQNDSEIAFRYERAHPGDVYFPWNLEASLLASGKLYDFDYGVHDRILAGDPPGPSELRAGLPTNMRAIAYPPQLVPSLDMLGLLPEYRQVLHIPGLEGFIVYGRTLPPAHLGKAGPKLQVSLAKPILQRS